MKLTADCQSGFGWRVEHRWLLFFLLFFRFEILRFMHICVTAAVKCSELEEMIANAKKRIAVVEKRYVRLLSPVWHERLQVCTLTAPYRR
jgi:hypothetical protein